MRAPTVVERWKLTLVYALVILALLLGQVVSAWLL